MSIEESNHDSAAEGEPMRRRGDRRVTDLDVPSDRRKDDRRARTPGLTALIRTLLRRNPSGDA